MIWEIAVLKDKTIIILREHMNRAELEKLIKSKDFNRKLIKAEFDKGTDLSNMDLHDIDFTDAIGDNIDFANSDLSNCDFTGTRFENVNFDSANLQGAILKNCDMRFANFHKAD